MTEAPFRQSKPIPGSHVEIPDSYCPRSFQGRRSVLVGVLVDLVAEGYSTEPEAKLRFVDLPRAVIHRNPQSLRLEQNNGRKNGFHDAKPQNGPTKTSG